MPAREPITTPITITLALEQHNGCPAQRWIDPIVNAWPSRLPRPAFETVPLEALIEGDATSASLPGELTTRVVLAVMGHDDHSLVRAYKLVDELHQTLCPAVLLFDAPDEKLRMLARDGVLVESWSVDPIRLASIVSTLARRQPLIERLEREVRVAQALHAGAESELTRMLDELHLAASVQREFIPDAPPSTPGLGVGVVYRPAGQVSGDIYDIRRLDDHRTGFFLADAAGHGVPAALMTLVIARSMRMTMDSADGSRLLEPSEALAALNRQLTERSGSGCRFATACYAVFDAQSRQVTVAGAGHPPPLLTRGNSVSRIQTAGPLLGVFSEADYDQVTVDLAPGDSILMFSDGFETAFQNDEASESDLRVPNEQYLEHLAQLSRVSGCERTLETAITTFERALDQQSGSLHQIDDLTALLIAPLSDASDTRRVA